MWDKSQAKKKWRGIPGMASEWEATGGEQDRVMKKVKWEVR